MTAQPRPECDPDGDVRIWTRPPGDVGIVFPPDERRRVSPTTALPYRTVGEVEMTFPNGKSYTGTGTMITSRHVLTCAHNLFDAQDGGWATSVAFIPARDGGTDPYGAFQARQIFVPELYRALSPPNPNSHGGVVGEVTLYVYDFGLIDLGKDVGVGSYPPVAASNSELKSEGVRISGYPGDKPAGTMWTEPGMIGGLSEDLLFYQIDTYEGQSGSSLMMPWNAPQGLVGVHVAGSELYDTNFGVRLNQGNIALIRHWILSSQTAAAELA